MEEVGKSRKEKQNRSLIGERGKRRRQAKDEAPKRRQREPRQNGFKELKQVSPNAQDR